jgi:L-cysteine S-thiosulfotransferase
MKRIAGSPFAALSALALLLAGTPLALAAEGDDAAKQGKEVAFNRNKGNCLACHQMGDGESPGNIAPPLIAMKARYPDRTKLKAQISDPQSVNPDTAMPPFGKHGILSDGDLEKVVDYVWGL